MEYHDATKIADYQRCPKLYDYKHVQGFRQKGDNVDIAFGHLLGGALERFEKDLLDGKAHDAAHTDALGWVLDNSVNPDGTHRFGSYVGTWRCLGGVSYRNDKGNPAKCPYSHKGKYFPTPAPEVCSCGSGVELVQLWVPTKASKDLTTLLELFVGYSDAAHSRALKPIKVEGKAAVEKFWEMPFSNGQMLRPVMLCGNLDAIKAFGPEVYIVDYKTTGKSLDARYWASFNPNVQVDLYNMCAEKALPDLDIRGVAIEAFSTSGGTSAFKVFKPTAAQKAEMAEDTAYWVGQLQRNQEAGVWPRNRSACFACAFQSVCSRSPEERETILQQNFERGLWNPVSRSVEPIGTPSQSTSIPTITSSSSVTSKPSCNDVEPPTDMPSTTGI